MAISTVAPELKISINAGMVVLQNRTVKLGPLVEGMMPAFENSAKRVIKEMGIGFGRKTIAIEVYDARGYGESLFRDIWPAIEKATWPDEQSRQANAALIMARKKSALKYSREDPQFTSSGGRFDNLTKNIHLNMERDLLDANAAVVSIIKNDSEFKNIIEWAVQLPFYNTLKDADRLLGSGKKGEKELLFEIIARSIINESFTHEFAHANHYFYKPDFFPDLDIVMNLGLKQGGHKNSEAENKIQLSEGVAYYISNKLRREDDGAFAADAKFPEKNISWRRLQFLRGNVKLGEWFVTQVAKLVENNPIKLVIDNPPTLFQLFYPKKYVKEMEREGKVALASSEE